MFWIWLGICIICIGIEFASPALVSIWFVIGGIVALVLSCFEPIAWYWQLLAFMGISLIALFAIRPVAKKFLKRNQTEANAEGFTGKDARMVTPADFDTLGTVVINGVTWNVRSRNGEELAAGEIVTVVAMDGNKLVVEKSTKVEK